MPETTKQKRAIVFNVTQKLTRKPEDVAEFLGGRICYIEAGHKHTFIDVVLSDNTLASLSMPTPELRLEAAPEQNRRVPGKETIDRNIGPLMACEDCDQDPEDCDGAGACVGGNDE